MISSMQQIRNVIPSVARNLLSPLSCRGGACPARAQSEASVKQASIKIVIPSEARNLLFVRAGKRTANYSDRQGGSAGTAEGFGGVAGFVGVTGLFADAGLLCDATLPTVKYLRIFSRRFGPMPRMAVKSSTLLNAPYDLRICKILSAVTGPIPGTNCNSSDVAVFKLTGAAGGFLFASKPGQTEASKRRTSESRASIR
jgi:hypothetical protein